MRPDHRVLHHAPLIPRIRQGLDTDAPAFIALIRRCWADHHLILHVDEEEPELRALATHFARQHGALWIAGAGRAMVATRPTAPGTWEICRLYVHPDLHGTGLAQHLMHLAETHAAATHLELWTDTRFARAHRFYERLGYVRTGTRALADRAASHEYRYEKPGPALPSAPA